MAKIGAPSMYTEELAIEICDCIADTPDMLEELCEKHEHWPIAKTIRSWRRKREDFGLMYARAKQDQIETLLEHQMYKLRKAFNDFYIDEEGRKKVNMAAIARLKMENDNTKFFAAKLAPKIYGQKITIEDNTSDKNLLEKAKEEILKLREKE